MRMPLRLFVLPLLVAALGALPQPSAALETEWIDLDFSQVRLVSANAAVGESTMLRLGLQIKMKPGFKTYWRSPGDAGIPPRFDWTGSNNLSHARVRWPAPVRFVLGGFNTFGYANEVVLPIDLELVSPGHALEARLQLVYGVCRDICVLGEAELVLAIPAGTSDKTEHHDLIDWFDQMVPTKRVAAVDISSASLVRADDHDVIEIEAVTLRGPGFVMPDVLVEGVEDIALPAPQIAVASDRQRAKISYRLPAAPARLDLAAREVTLTLLDGDYAFEKKVVLSSKE